MNDNRGSWTSASNAESDHACPGRHLAQVGLPELPSTGIAESGTRIHAIWAGEGAVNATPEELDKAEMLFDQEREIATAYFGEKEAFETVRFTEKRLWHEFGHRLGTVGTLRTSGRFDIVRLHTASGKAAILDGKTGWLDVTPNPSNLQLRRLASLLYIDCGPVEIAVAILKPYGKPPQPCVYDADDLERAVAEMEQHVSVSHDPGSPRIPGPDQCRYCRAQHTCPERLAWLSAALPAVSPPLPMVSAKDWTPAQRSLFLEREKQARDWLEERKDEIKALLTTDPNAAPGYGLKEGRTTETINDPQEVFQRFARNLSGTTEQFMSAVKVLKGGLKDAVRAATQHKGKQLEQDLDALLDGCVESKTSAPTIEKAA